MYNLRLGPDGGYGLWVTRTHRCRFVSFDKRITRMLDADRRGGCVHVVPAVCGNSVPSAQFCCELETALKIKAFFYFLKKRERRKYLDLDSVFTFGSTPKISDMKY